MKTLLYTLLFLLILPSAYAQNWPRNPKTHKVEFAGVLPWPAQAKTEAQRRALVRRWYLAKLTTATPASVSSDAATNRTNGLLTYAGLPKVVVLRNGEGEAAQYLTYQASLVPNAGGLRVTLFDFGTGRGGQYDTPLETHLTAPASNEQAALAALRARLAKAVAAWN